jgi:hypothetical protein
MGESKCPLRPGFHAWVYPLPGSIEKWDSICAELMSHGVTGVIPQQGLNAASWFRRQPERARIAEKYGLQVTLGLGMDGNNAHRAMPRLIQSVIKDALSLRECNVMLNWESAWNGTEDRQRAREIVTDVLADYPNARERVVDCPWWAPQTTPNGTPTHPGAPTREFGSLCAYRFPQTYGANARGNNDGVSTRMLAHSRSQYPGLGTPADRIFPSLQLYNRSLTDHVNTLLADTVVCLWQWSEADSRAKLALRYVNALARHGFTGPNASRDFQVSRGIPGPSRVGPLALAAAGIDSTA